MKTKKDLINEIKVNAANFEYCAKTGKINGSLLVDIERIMQEYTDQQLRLGVVMPELLCIDNNYATGITKGKKYTALFENKLTWFLKDDDDEIWGYEKTHFEVISAQ